jgi:hypothetical protein
MGEKTGRQQAEKLYVGSGENQNEDEERSTQFGNSNIKSVENPNRENWEKQN